jgi:hypothetical protein
MYNEEWTIKTFQNNKNNESYYTKYTRKNQNNSTTEFKLVKFTEYFFHSVNITCIFVSKNELIITKKSKCLLKDRKKLQNVPNNNF